METGVEVVLEDGDGLQPEPLGAGEHACASVLSLVSATADSSVCVCGRQRSGPRGPESPCTTG